MSCSIQYPPLVATHPPLEPRVQDLDLVATHLVTRQEGSKTQVLIHEIRALAHLLKGTELVLNEVVSFCARVAGL